MSSSLLVGVVLVATGALDIVLALVVVGPRLPEKKRKTVQMSMLLGAILVVVLGVLFLTGSVGSRPGA